MRIRRLGAAVLAVAASALAAHATAAERYTGQIINLSGGGRGSVTAFFTLHIDSYSSDKEVAGLLQALRNKGQQGLQEALWETKEKGWFRIGDALGYHAAVIRATTAPDGVKMIRVFTDRPIMFYEVRNNTRSRNYPFGSIELKIQADGTGEGRMIAAASAKATETGVEIENFDVTPFLIKNLKREM